MASTLPKTYEDRAVPLGRSGLRVSPLGTGTNRWAFGSNDEAVRATFATLLETGVDFFDTAEVYTSGNSERLLGACLQHAPGDRRAVVASKFRPFPERLTRAAFMAALDGSLQRLRLESLDLYYVHIPPTVVTVATVMDWMADAVRARKIRAVGVSNFSAAQMRRAAERLADHGIALAANQVEYNLFNREPETNGVLDACRELDTALVAYKPLGRGRLVDGADATGSLGLALRDIAAGHGGSIVQVALNWLRARDPRVIPIPGTSNAGHALENAGALDWQLSEHEATSIDRALAQ